MLLHFLLVTKKHYPISLLMWYWLVGKISGLYFSDTQNLFSKFLTSAMAVQKRTRTRRAPTPSPRKQADMHWLYGGLVLAAWHWRPYIGIGSFAWRSWIGCIGCIGCMAALHRHWRHMHWRSYVFISLHSVVIAMMDVIEAGVRGGSLNTSAQTVKYSLNLFLIICFMVSSLHILYTVYSGRTNLCYFM